MWLLHFSSEDKEITLFVVNDNNKCLMHDLMQFRFELEHLQMCTKSLRNILSRIKAKKLYLPLDFLSQQPNLSQSP